MSTTLSGLRLGIWSIGPLFIGALGIGTLGISGLGISGLGGGLSRALAAPPEIVVPPSGDLVALVQSVPAGGRILLKAGVHRPQRALKLERAGVTLAGEPGAELHPPEGLQGDALLTVAADGVRITGLVLDGEFVASRAIRSLQGSRDLRIEGCEIRFWAKHAVDLDGANQLVSNCHIHHILQKANGARSDAHGIVTLHSKGLRVQGCRINNCSGDSFQADRGTWQNLEFVDCDLSLEPLAEPLGGFEKGEVVGENAFDLKRESKLARGQILIEECRMWGFDGSTEASNWTALNLKENVAVTVRNCSVKQSQIGARLAAFRRGSPLICQFENCSFDTCRLALRFEDLRTGPEADAISLSVENCQFGQCDLHLLFDKFRKASGQAVWQLPKGVRITRSVFDPSLRIALGTGDPKVLKEAAGQLLSLGENREENPPPALAETTNTQVRAVAAAANPAGPSATPPRSASPRSTPTSVAVSEPVDDSTPVCPRDESHRGRVYRRAAGQLHCRCGTCGTVWTLADKSSSPTQSPPAGTRVAGKEPPGTNTKRTGTGNPAPATTAAGTTAAGTTGNPPSKVVK
jgi:hypothetical protein